MSRCLKFAAFLVAWAVAVSQCNSAFASRAKRSKSSRNDLLHTRSEADQFCTSANRNLTDWRSSLYRRTMELYKVTERRLGTVAEPVGHARFSLFSPFVSCENQGSLTRVGNNEDGMSSFICDGNEQERKIDTPVLADSDQKNR
jgi:hypothetical protein